MSKYNLKDICVKFGDDLEESDVEAYLLMAVSKDGKTVPCFVNGNGEKLLVLLSCLMLELAKNLQMSATSLCAILHVFLERVRDEYEKFDKEPSEKDCRDMFNALKKAGIIKDESTDA